MNERGESTVHNKEAGAATGGCLDFFQPEYLLRTVRSASDPLTAFTEYQLDDRTYSVWFGGNAVLIPNKKSVNLLSLDRTEIDFILAIAGFLGGISTVAAGARV